MKLYKTTITPISNFASSLKGDQLFGQMCWTVKFAFGESRLQELLSTYEEHPFLVVSDAFTHAHLPKPNLPSSFLNENPDLKKENRKKIWLTLDELQKGEFNSAKTDTEALNSNKSSIIVRNSINYLTSTTGDGFDPYSEEEFALSQQDIYFLIDEERFGLSDLEESFKYLSKLGYGKDTTVGKGRFDFSSFEEVTLDKAQSSTYITLSPSSLQDINAKELFYTPFTRFGKLGYDRASKNAFKNPLVLSDTAAVVVFDDAQKYHYIGKAIKNISTYKDVVHQGYSIVIPIKEIDNADI
jgi:CRISPR-associated protein Csm4